MNGIQIKYFENDYRYIYLKYSEVTDICLSIIHFIHLRLEIIVLLAYFSIMIVSNIFVSFSHIFMHK